MHPSKATCAHGHPWYRLDCLKCRHNDFHDMLRDPVILEPRRFPQTDPNGLTMWFEALLPVVRRQRDLTGIAD